MPSRASPRFIISSALRQGGVLLLIICPTHSSSSSSVISTWALKRRREEKTKQEPNYCIIRKEFRMKEGILARNKRAKRERNLSEQTIPREEKEEIQMTAGRRNNNAARAVSSYNWKGRKQEGLVILWMLRRWSSHIIAPFKRKISVEYRVTHGVWLFLSLSLYFNSGKKKNKQKESGAFIKWV